MPGPRGPTLPGIQSHSPLVVRRAVSVSVSFSEVHRRSGGTVRVDRPSTHPSMNAGERPCTWPREPPTDLESVRPQATSLGRRAPLRGVVRLPQRTCAWQSCTGPHDGRDRGWETWLVRSPGVERSPRRALGAGGWRWSVRRDATCTVASGRRTPSRGARKPNARRRHASVASDPSRCEVTSTADINDSGQRPHGAV